MRRSPRHRGRRGKLIRGVALLLRHPEVAYRDCGDCQLHVYDHATGERMKGRDGLPLVRPPKTFAPCRYGKDRCAKGTPEDSGELSEKNKRAYERYQEWKATGQFPDDPIVRRNAGILRQMEECYLQETQRTLAAVMSARG